MSFSRDDLRTHSGASGFREGAWAGRPRAWRGRRRWSHLQQTSTESVREKRVGTVSARRSP